MYSQIEDMIKRCDLCQTYASSRPMETEIEDPNPATEPMSKLGCDLFHFEGKEYLFVIDIFSSYCWLKQFRHCPSSQMVCEFMMQLWREVGLPDRVRCDNGPQFRGPFEALCDDMKVKVEHSSPYNPVSNGSAEKGLGVLKKLLKKCSDSGESFDKAFAIYKDTPRGDCVVSPSRLFYRRQKRLEGLPNLKDNFDEILLGEQLMKKKQADKEKRNEKIGPHTGGPKCTTLKVGKHVWLQDVKTKLWDIKCVVLEVNNSGMSGILEAVETKKQYHRNRRMIQDCVIQEDEDLIEALTCQQDARLKSCLRRSVLCAAVGQSSKRIKFTACSEDDLDEEEISERQWAFQERMRMTEDAMERRAMGEASSGRPCTEED
jgi:hypothetical protein